MDGLMEERNERWMDGRKKGMEERNEGMKKGRKDERKG